MGLFKDMDIEQGELGFIYAKLDSICDACVTDPWLADFILSTGTVGPCSYCDADGRTTAFVKDLFAHMARCIRAEYCPSGLSINVPAREWGMDAPSISSGDLLDHYGLPLGDAALHEAFVDAFENDWIAEDVWVGGRDEHLLAGWERFVDELKHTSRFVFLRRTDPDFVSRVPGIEIEANELLDKLQEVIDECSLVVKLDTGSKVVRGRKHRPDEVLVDPTDLGPPPTRLADGQRMSPPGIPFFYSATDDATALAELRGVDGEVATLADWVTQRDCMVVDLAQLPLVPSIFDQDLAHMRPVLKFLHRFVAEISRPMRANDDPAVDYVPTQVVAEYIRHCVWTDGNEHPEGIRYPSSAHEGGTNVVLFPKTDDGEDSPHLLRRDGRPRRYEATVTRTTWRTQRAAEAPVVQSTATEGEL